MARSPKRLAGPALITNAAADKYTVPAVTTAVVRMIQVSNPTVSAVAFTLSIGADAAGTRLWDAYSIPAGEVRIFHVYIVLAAAEKIQALAGTNNVMTLSIFGDEIT